MIIENFLKIQTGKYKPKDNTKNTRAAAEDIERKKGIRLRAREVSR